MASVTEEIELVSEDGENLESDWHRLEIGLLVEMVRCGWKASAEYYMAGNMFIYFSREQARNRDFRGPDFFLVKNVSGHIRPYWVMWEEGGRLPDVIIELMPPSTKDEDLTRKKHIYETVFKTPDYFCYDPDTQELLGWRLTADHYEPLLPNDKGWLWCQELGFWLGTWEGEYLGHRAVWLRFFDGEGNVVPGFTELTHAAAERTLAERQRAETERQRAEVAEAELARLRSQLPKQP
jgi:Uma2 family endonuclease